MTAVRTPGSDSQPIIFGEVLYDCFEDGSSVLGGAPFNVAWHLQGFGLAPLLISRIGRDDLGHGVVAAMTHWGMRTDGLQQDPERPTGTVRIALADGQPTFDIRADQAYDHIAADDAVARVAAEHGSVLYHGSLAARAGSATALAALRERCALPTFVDINLRTPWWRREGLAGLLRGSRWAKLNHEELAIVAELPPGADLAEGAVRLRRRFDIELLIVTRGAEGALLADATGVREGKPVPVPRLMDTVGAGDAFSAVVLLGLSRGWPPPRILQRALELASGVCGIRGAAPSDRGFYESYRRRWEQDDE